MHTVSVGGINVAAITRGGLANLILKTCLDDRSQPSVRPRLLFDLNAHGISLAATDRTYRECLLAADFVHADGQSVVFASRVLHGRLGVPERTATTDLIHDVAKRSAGVNPKFFLLGSEEHVVRSTADRLAAEYPGVEIVGSHHGYFDAAESHVVYRLVRDSGAEIVWVGMGKPREQQFARELAMHCSASWVITAGGCFNFIAGVYTRAPHWMQRAGLEWLHRMCTGPRYLIPRYALTNVHAMMLIARMRRRPHQQ